MSSPLPERPDIVLIGAGVMSASFAALIRSLDPALSIAAFETLDACGLESSQAWNNAGTGHAAYCELNYTSQRPDGSVDISKALDVNTEFDISRQLWAHWVREGWIDDPARFIRTCPHMSFVWGQKNVAFLRARYDAMSAHHCFAGMEYTEDPDIIAQWAPLVMQGRDRTQPLAATRTMAGTDVDFGALTRALFGHLAPMGGMSVQYRHQVTGLSREADGRWRVTAREIGTGKTVSVSAGFVFVGAGGAALKMLQAAHLPEAHGYAGFPVSGQWLRCDDPDLAARHFAKVYGKAAVGSPPMSVPHLDTRVIDGRRYLLFGPYAGFTTKFLKRGSWTDLPGAARPDNILPMIQVGMDNVALVKYLVEQVVQSDSQRFSALLDYFPDAAQPQWERAVAGQRVQIIKKENGRGVLKFGTEIVRAGDNSLVAVLGASPGASIAGSIALQVVETCFGDRLASEWRDALLKIFPFYGRDFKTDAEACMASRHDTGAVLHI
ncbi:malate dehydrogenase (quinone) [Acidomonas methanolica]|uniref:malate dehydrogenase (quinone) n=1 Tax=Acidomonas methanolica TaxID=437 RepID=UPI00211A8D56|nr:malate dehydrogenase (quinone) [Acidomonas methanolica]MCQ9156604.1 malate dehydrogenase (quinone) [Acidomonas methanolica]